MTQETQVKHSEWRFIRRKGYIEIYAPNKAAMGTHEVARIVAWRSGARRGEPVRYTFPAEVEANAHLIVSAPRLLEASQAALVAAEDGVAGLCGFCSLEIDVCNSYDTPSTECAGRMLRAVIAQAVQS